MRPVIFYSNSFFNRFMLFFSFSWWYSTYTHLYPAQLDFPDIFRSPKISTPYYLWVHLLLPSLPPNKPTLSLNCKLQHMPLRWYDCLVVLYMISKFSGHTTIYILFQRFSLFLMRPATRPILSFILTPLGKQLSLKVTPMILCTYTLLTLYLTRSLFPRDDQTLKKWRSASLVSTRLSFH